MSRLAIRLPIVARRSPAITTPSAYADGDDRGGVRREVGRPGRAAAAGGPGSRSGAADRSRSVNDGLPAAR